MSKQVNKWFKLVWKGLNRDLSYVALEELIALKSALSKIEQGYKKPSELSVEIVEVTIWQRANQLLDVRLEFVIVISLVTHNSKQVFHTMVVVRAIAFDILHKYWLDLFVPREYQGRRYKCFKVRLKNATVPLLIKPVAQIMHEL
jgi:hypothetical protein